MPYFRRKSARKPYKKRPYARRKVASKSKVSFAKKVNAVIQRKAEHKCMAVNTQSYCMPYSSGTLTEICLTPNASYLTCPQGITQGTRIGNKIRVLKAMLRGVLYPLKYDAIYNATPLPWEVRFIIGSGKINPTIAMPVPEFFQSGGTSSPPTGGLSDQFLTPNSDVNTIKKQKFYKVSNASIHGSGGTVGSQYFTNNDFKLNAKVNIDITNYVPKEIQWNDNATIPTSQSVWCMIIPSSADGSVSTTSFRSLMFDWFVEYTYTDI